MNSTYSDLPDHSRVWIYQSDREFSEQEVAQLRTDVDVFLADWGTHGTALKAAIELFYNRFIVVFVDEMHVGASGCSIDSSVRLIKETEQKYGVQLMDRMLVAFRGSEEIKTLHLNEFDNQVKAGEISASTIVFNNLVKDKAEFIKGWEVELENSWHQQLLVH